MRRADAQPLAILVERHDIRRHERVDVGAGLPRLGDDAVIHVGQVHDLEHLVPARLEPPPQQVLEEEGAEVSDVAQAQTVGPQV